MVSEHLFCKQGVGGSIPSTGFYIIAKQLYFILIEKAFYSDPSLRVKDDEEANRLENLQQ